MNRIISGETRQKGKLVMNQKRRIRLSTMEIVLIATLIGTLLLSLLQAFQQERLLAADHRDRDVSGEHQ